MLSTIRFVTINLVLLISRIFNISEDSIVCYKSEALDVLLVRDVDNGADVVVVVLVLDGVGHVPILDGIAVCIFVTACKCHSSLRMARAAFTITICLRSLKKGKQSQD